MLATFSAYGGRINKALDKDILGAYLSKFVCHANNKIHYIVLLTGMSNLSMQSPKQY